MSATGTLANAVVQISVNRAGLTAGLAAGQRQLLGFVSTATALGARVGAGLFGAVGQGILARKMQDVAAAARAAQAAVGTPNWAAANANLRAVAASYATLATRIAAVAVAASAATTAVAAMAGVLTALAAAGGVLAAGEHNVEQVFGKSTAMVRAGAEEQARAFGRSKSEYLAYAAEVGRSLEMLGVSEETAAQQTTELLAAVSRLAESRRIGFGEAYRTIQGRGAGFTDEQLRAYAVEKGILQNRNQMLNAGAEAILRNMLAIEEINRSAEHSAGSGANWNSQLNRLLDNLANLAQLIGAELEPAFVGFMQTINEWLQAMIEGWKEWKGVILDALDPLGLLHGGGSGPAADLGKISDRNAGRIGAAGNRQAIGEAMRGHVGPYQGGLEGFARHIQQASWSQAQARIQRQQLEAAQKAVDELKKLNEAQPWRLPENRPENNPARFWF